ncbi:PP2C family protein-serine/threonine phosphatase [Modestobacter italicus]|uniref:PP2C family protein-serine/threonine phosphatase n=1 Tax=Modestobacter italicus (strain DSM 44449 / CECT 9708 / BC 501) TaxID=2732864 RepID=UPI0027E00BA5|nr:PP2C family protein-serine/threonine phosphatase [Modestobacter italicus]
MNRRLRTRHLLPLGVLLFCSLVNLASEPGQVVVGLLAMAPLVAATVLGRRATAVYGLVAFTLAALFGIYGDQYTEGTVVAQSIRLLGVALGGVLALFACTLRLRREAALTRLSAEAAMARGAVQVAETLQRSLLTDPPTVPGLAIAARYLPAVQHAQVGGDWYDAFPVPGGSTMLVIGDVAGHDVTAAATMAQARGVLRGIGTTVAGSPALVLGALDRAMAQLQVDTLITAAVATVHPAGPDSGPRLDWSNAGHPPPVLMSADGRVTVLDRAPDLLLGVAAGVERAEHHLALTPGDTLLLYTDGLVERRGVPLDAGTSWLTQRLAELAGLPLEELCDELIAGMSGRLDDDVAVLAVRIC